MTERKPKRAAPRGRAAAERREAQVNAQSGAPSDAAGDGSATGTVTTAALLRELEEARTIAIAKKQPTPAIAAILAKARIAGLSDDRLDTPTAGAAPRAGSYADAVRRISYLLRQANIEKRGGSTT